MLDFVSNFVFSFIILSTKKAIAEREFAIASN